MAAMHPELKWRIAAAALAVGAGEVVGLWAATVVVTPVADSWMSETPLRPPPIGINPVRAGTTGGGVRVRGIFRFDLSGMIPVGAVVRSATFTVQVTTVPSFDVQNSLFELRRVLQGWEEASVSWNERSPGSAWNSPGASAAGDVAGTASATAFVSATGSYTFGSSDPLVADVQAWVNSPGANFGWRLHTQSESTPRTARLFASREADATIRPSLSVTYDLPATPPTLTVLPVANGELRFSFPAEANRPYVVEARDFFGVGAWGAVLNLPAPGAATVLTVTNPVVGGAGFFRVRTP